MDLLNDSSLNNSPGWQIPMLAISETSYGRPKEAQADISYLVKNYYTGKVISVTAPTVMLAVAHAFLTDCGEPRSIEYTEHINNQIIDHRYVVRCGNWFADQSTLL